MLLEAPGQLFSREDILARVWADMTVEASNVAVAVVSLRKALGGDYVEHLAGRGYRFAQDVFEDLLETQSMRSLDAIAPDEASARLIGRADETLSLVRLLESERLMSIVGAGGMGKSSLARTVVATLGRQRRIAWADLGPLAETAMVAATVAAAVGQDQAASIESVAERIADTPMLLVIDNCEHLVDGAAEVCEALVTRCANLCVLTTSRQPLRIAGERLFHLGPLAVPPDDAVLGGEDLTAFPAVALFATRMAEAGVIDRASSAELRLIAEVCRRLDGVPLAIELAAARAALFGVSAFVEQFERRFGGLLGARRGALPHQRSLEATLDWSYELLSASEQVLFRRLGTFRGWFPVDAAMAVASLDGFDAQLPGDLVGLVAKSLLVPGPSRGGRYRLLETTRDYAASRLKASGEWGAVMQAHADHLNGVMETAESDWNTLPPDRWRERYAYRVDDVRAVLDWALEEGHQPEIGVRLTAAALPFAFQVSLMDEFRGRADRAAKRLGSMIDPDPLVELRLKVGLSLFHLNSALGSPEADALFDRAIELAERLDATRYSIEPLTTKVVTCIERGDHAAGLVAAADLMRSAARTEDPLAILLGHRVRAQAAHFAGDFAASRSDAHRVLAHKGKSIPLVYSRGGVDPQVSMRAILARTLWIEGFADQAKVVADECRALAAHAGALAEVQALALGACPVALWRGDIDHAWELVDRLLATARRHDLARWAVLGEHYAALLTSDSPSPSVGPTTVFQKEQLASIDKRWFDASLESRSLAGLSGWCGPELIRLAGLERARADSRAGEALLVRAIADARQLDALAWELRAACDLSRLRLANGRKREARAPLQAAYGRFSEGFGTRDLKTAKALLDALDA
jgi:predicted ATPase